MVDKYEVVVIGAGPAGSTCAHALASKGISTLCIDKEVFPRHKPCGGAVSGRAYRTLHIPLDSLIRSRVTAVEVEYKKKALRYASDTPIAYLVNRAEFDNYLVQVAIDAGSRFRDGVKVEHVETHRSSVTVHTSSGSITAEAAVLAAGAASRLLGTGKTAFFGTALEGEIDYLPKGCALGSATILFSMPKGGYSWVFPKKNSLSFGSCCLSNRRSSLRTAYEQIIERMGLSMPEIRTTGHPIPLGGNPATLSRTRLAVVGDAAHLADPLSGEGILYAIQSGQCAASCIERALLTGDFSLADYQEEIKQQILSRIGTAKRLAQIVYRFPRPFFELLSAAPGLLDLYLASIEGSTSLASVRRALVAELTRRFDTPNDIRVSRD